MSSFDKTIAIEIVLSKLDTQILSLKGKLKKQKKMKRMYQETGNKVQQKKVHNAV